MCIWIQPDGVIKCRKYKIIVIAFTNLVNYYTPVIKVKNCTQIQLFNSRADIIFELCHISQPLLIWLICVKISFQDVLSCDQLYDADRIP
jgi:hypothetical protein